MTTGTPKGQLDDGGTRVSLTVPSPLTLWLASQHTVLHLDTSGIPRLYVYQTVQAHYDTVR